MTSPLDAALRGHTRALLTLWRPNRKGPPDRLTHDELREVAQAVKRLSAGLSGERNKAGRDYLGTEDGRTAYLLHFWPVSYAQTRAALKLAGLSPPPGGGHTKGLGLGGGDEAAEGLVIHAAIIRRIRTMGFGTFRFSREIARLRWPHTRSDR